MHRMHAAELQAGRVHNCRVTLFTEYRAMCYYTKRTNPTDVSCQQR